MSVENCIAKERENGMDDINVQVRNDRASNHSQSILLSENGDRTSKYLKKYDANNDGRLSRDELSQLIIEMNADKRANKLMKYVVIIGAVMMILLFCVTLGASFVAYQLFKEFKIERDETRSGIKYGILQDNQQSNVYVAEPKVSAALNILAINGTSVEDEVDDFVNDEDDDIDALSLNETIYYEEEYIEDDFIKGEIDYDIAYSVYELFNKVGKAGLDLNNFGGESDYFHVQSCVSLAEILDNGLTVNNGDFECKMLSDDGDDEGILYCDSDYQGTTNDVCSITIQNINDDSLKLLYDSDELSSNITSNLGVDFNDFNMSYSDLGIYDHLNLSYQESRRRLFTDNIEFDAASKLIGYNLGHGAQIFFQDSTVGFEFKWQTSKKWKVGWKKCQKFCYKWKWNGKCKKRKKICVKLHVFKKTIYFGVATNVAIEFCPNWKNGTSDTPNQWDFIISPEAKLGISGLGDVKVPFTLTFPRTMNNNPFAKYCKYKDEIWQEIQSMNSIMDLKNIDIDFSNRESINIDVPMPPPPLKIPSAPWLEANIALGITTKDELTVGLKPCILLGIDSIPVKFGKIKNLLKKAKNKIGFNPTLQFCPATVSVIETLLPKSMTSILNVLA